MNIKAKDWLRENWLLLAWFPKANFAIEGYL
jgi:hypothetical protein